MLTPPHLGGLIALHASASLIFSCTASRSDAQNNGQRYTRAAGKRALSTREEVFATSPRKADAGAGCGCARH